MAKTAAAHMIEAFTDWGVDTIFGLPGDGINGIMEALRTHQDRVRFIQVRHEEAAAFAACGYAKFTGRLGVCLATSGPGAIHLLNGPLGSYTGDMVMEECDTLLMVGSNFPYARYLTQPGQAHGVQIAVDETHIGLRHGRDRRRGDARPADAPYRKNPVSSQVEVRSFLGDVALGDGEPKLHVHVVCGLPDGRAVGGHLLEGHVRPTLEVIVTEPPGHLRRQYDPVSGLPLLRP